MLAYRYKNSPSIKKNMEGGFTLVELIIVLIIVSLIATVSLAYVRLSPTKGKAVYDHIMELTRAAQVFANDTGCYPASVPILYNDSSANVTNYGSGIGNCQPNLNQWRGPYISGIIFSGANEHIGMQTAGEQNNVIGYQEGGWLDNMPEMNGRNPTELAVVDGPLSAGVLAQVCTRCGGCVTPGASSGVQTMCFESGDTVGYVFATIE